MGFLHEQSACEIKILGCLEFRKKTVFVATYINQPPVFRCQNLYTLRYTLILIVNWRVIISYLPSKGNICPPYTLNIELS